MPISRQVSPRHRPLHPTTRACNSPDSRKFVVSPPLQAFGIAVALTISTDIKRKGEESDEDGNTTFRSSDNDRYGSRGPTGYGRFPTRTRLDGDRAGIEPSKSAPTKIAVSENFHEEATEMLVNRTALRSEKAVEMPIGLNHVDSDVCWCEPIVETDEDGEKVVVHREIIWN